MPDGGPSVSVPFRGLFFLYDYGKITGDQNKVSVPFRGLFFLYYYNSDVEGDIDNGVSVPFRGLFFLYWK